MTPPFNKEFSIFLPITSACIRRKIEKEPDIEVIYLTSPTYEGVICNYDELVKEYGDDKMIIIDEAHGAHFYFSEQQP